MLINSAGLIVKGYKPDPAYDSKKSAPAMAEPLTGQPTGPPAIVADIVTSALLFYLEKTITRYCIKRRDFWPLKHFESRQYVGAIFGCKSALHSEETAVSCHSLSICTTPTFLALAMFLWLEYQLHYPHKECYV